MIAVYYHDQRMKFCLYFLVIALSSQAVSSQTCPSDHFSAVFTATVDTISTGKPSFGPDDPELSFFKETLGFRDADIKHTLEDTITFFNDTFGLDFSASAPNEKNERFFENAKMAPYILSNEHKMLANTNIWIHTGSTRTTCNRMLQGGFRVTFSGNRTLYGSYGGAEGKPAGQQVVLVYGINSIEGCQQSPVIIQFQCSNPLRVEPVDGTLVFNCDSYSRVLGHGRILGTSSITPILENPGQYRYTVRDVYTFPA